MSDQIKYMPKDLDSYQFISEVHSNSMRIHGFAEAALQNVATNLRIKVEMAVKYGDLPADGEMVENLMEIVEGIEERLAFLNELHNLKYAISNESFSKIKYRSTVQELIAMRPDNRQDLVTFFPVKK